ncbi:glycosyl hydrolase [Pedobacter sp. BS3]|uniref:glycosyl hydrolase n=1 Tax=Pedobacter sp. BS3 TaxID=2567937 RepID=UPI001658C8F6|nr:glycosyl hydrolase [Pedobacter sp. BS3]
MKLRLLLPLLISSVISGYGQDLRKFAEPDDEYRPGIFWDWMDDLVTKKGITSDLEHFKKFGLRGTLIMLVGSETGNYPFWQKHNMPNPVISQTPEFFEMWKFAAGESARLGLTMVTQLGPGWCHSGGPWVKPDQAVQHLEFTETETIQGPLKNGTFILGKDGLDLGKAYHSNLITEDKPHWVQIKLDKPANIDKIILYPFLNGTLVDFGFPKQFIVEVANKPDFSDKKVFYKTAGDYPQPNSEPVVLKGKANGQYIRLTTLKNYLLKRDGRILYPLSLKEIEVLDNGKNIAKNAEVTASSSIENYGYSLKSITDNYNGTASRQANNTYVLNQPGGQYYTTDIALVAFPDKAVVQPGEIIELTSKVNNGKLTWNVPPGSWKIRRYAMRNAQAFNRPAPIGGKGLECDKLDGDAVDAMFSSMVGRYLKDSPQLAGKTIKGFEADSWEVGNPEWTWKFRQEFIKRRGYDPIPWLLAFKTEQVVGSEELTKRFLNDMYLTQTDLFAANFFTHLADKAAANGMDFMTEPYMAPFDPIRMAGRVQVPTGEFWASGDCMNTLKWASSSAHTYGRKTVAAESFTGRWNDGNWKMDPYGIKRVGDLAFCQGVNKMYLHGTALQPWGTDVKPGMPMMFWGTMFAPGQTWLEPGKAWVDYLSRCQYLLSQGLHVADVAGVMPTLNWENAMPGGLHKKYDYDLLAEESLLNDMDWKDGYFVLPSGARYRVLFLPKTNGMMDVALIRKLTVLAQKGGIIVCQDKPLRAPGLSGYPKCDEDVQHAAAALWGKADGKTVFENRVGKGKLVWINTIYTDTDEPESQYFRDTRAENKAFYGRPAFTSQWSADFLKLLRTTSLPDVEVVKAGGKAMAWGGFEETTRGTRQGEDAIAWIHRRIGNNEVYFVSSQVATPNQSEMVFRVQGKVPELWDAETGKRYKPETWAEEGGRTKVSITFPPMGSVFVVFKPASEATATLPVYNAEQKVKSQMALNGIWNVSFPAGYGAPATARLAAGSLTENADPGIKYFSGTAAYQTDITLAKKQLQSNVILDLGKVRNLAEVLVNNVSAGVLWKPPFKADITSLLKPGKNTLTVKVTNTWWNRMVGDEQLPEDLKWGKKTLYAGNDYKGYHLIEIPKWVWNGEQRPSKDRVTFSTWKYVEKDSPLEPSGLIGPVNILFAEK